MSHLDSAREIDRLSEQLLLSRRNALKQRAVITKREPRVAEQAIAERDFSPGRQDEVRYTTTDTGGDPRQLQAVARGWHGQSTVR